MNFLEYTVTHTRPNVLWLLFLFNDQNFAQIAVKKFQDHVDGVNVIPESFRGVIYRTALAANGKPAYESFLKVLRFYVQNMLFA